MKILIAFIAAFIIGAASRWTGVPSLAPSAIVGALLIVTMSTGYVSADHFLKRSQSPSVAVSASKPANAAKSAKSQMGSYGPPPHPDSEADIAIWRKRAEDLQLIVADLLSANQQLRAPGSPYGSEDNGGSANLVN
jgi:XapX domain-containing protein